MNTENELNTITDQDKELLKFALYFFVEGFVDSDKTPELEKMVKKLTSGQYIDVSKIYMPHVVNACEERLTNAEDVLDSTPKTDLEGIEFYTEEIADLKRAIEILDKVESSTEEQT